MSETIGPVKLECSRCGSDIVLEEGCEPYRDEDIDDLPICGDCYHDNYEFECIQCCNYEHNSEQSKVLVIVEECGGLGPGVYRILRCPYFISDYFTMRWLPEALSRIGDAPQIENADYPSGHLCAECAAQPVGTAKPESDTK